jgi:type IV secretory pathway VirB10-like protein
MTGDPALDQLYAPLPPPPRVVRVRLIPWLLAMVALGGLMIGAYYWAKAAGWLTPVDQFKRSWETENNGIGLKNKLVYPAEKAGFTTAVNGTDPLEEFRREVNRRFGLLEGRMAALENELKARRQTTTTKTPAQPPKHRSMMFVSNKVDVDDIPAPDTYQLSPGLTKLPCIVETAMNSDVPSFFTAKIRTDVYDTATGHKKLVSQGDAVLGEYKSASLVFGNERLPSIGLTLAFQDGRSVDLGNVPVMTQEGMAGLVSRVNQHWWRNLGAVLIMGVLRGGQQAVITELGASNSGGAVASGIASTTAQFGQQKLNRAIDTRPTIEVDAGTLCHVLLTKPLHLPAVARR